MNRRYFPILLFLFLLLSFRGALFTIVHGFAQNIFFIPILALSVLATHTTLGLLFGGYQSFGNAPLKLTRNRFVVIPKPVNWCLIYFIFVFFVYQVPSVGFIMGINSGFGFVPTKKIDVHGVITSFEPETITTRFQSKFSHTKLTYKVMNVFGKEGQNYAIDIPEGYFLEHKKQLEIGQPWNDSFYLGLLGVPFRDSSWTLPKN